MNGTPQTTTTTNGGALPDVEETLNIVHSAFQDWRSIRPTPMAGNYLLAMLLSKQR